jgi:hypothetical protein
MTKDHEPTVPTEADAAIARALLQALTRRAEISR